ANAQHSGTMLASVESGSSFAIDAGLYQEQQAAATAPSPAFSPVQATYSLPRDEPAGGPRWFVVQVANAFDSNQGKVTSSEYLLFTQSAAGGGWQDTIEPYLLSGASAPRIAVGADGLATAAGPDAASVTVPPSQLPAATAASLDGTGAGGAGTGTATGAVEGPGNLADLADQKFWQGKVPGGTVTDTHTAATGADGQEFALLTTDGGALVFYTDAGQHHAAGDHSRLLLPEPGALPGRGELPRAVRRLRPASGRRRAPGRRRLLGDHRQGLARRRDRGVARGEGELAAQVAEDRVGVLRPRVSRRG